MKIIFINGSSRKDGTTAQCHSQMGGYAVGAEYVCDWIKNHL